MRLGDAAPRFSLPGVEGATHALDDYAAADALVLVQSCNHCPYVRAWEGRLKSIQADYAGRGVQLVAVSSNNAASHPDDSFPEMAKRAQRESFNFDYLYDEDQSFARALGSERTPEVFLFDRDRRLRYHGAVDDSRNEDAVTQDYLRDALDAVLDGGEPEPAETAAVGCTVKWRA